MVIYCDRLTIGSCIQIVRLCWRDMLSSGREKNIKILDPIPNRSWSLMLRKIMQLLGFQIEDTSFFAGHLRLPDGQVVFLAARTLSVDLATQAAEHILADSKHLKQVNQEWGRNTILMHIARTLELPALQVALRFKVTEALVCGERDSNVFLIVQRLSTFNSDMLRQISPNLNVHFYYSWLYQYSGVKCFAFHPYDFLKHKRFSVIFFLLFSKLIAMSWLLKGFFEKNTNGQKYFDISESNLPSLLMLQEDNISLNRSYRTQPHWLFVEDGKPPFMTLLLQTNSKDNIDIESLKQQNVILISKKDQYLFARRFRSSHPVQRRLRKYMRKCVLLSVLGSSVEVGVAYVIVKLLYTSNILASICQCGNVRAFMTCENYVKEVDATQIIAPHLGITTISFQYANVGRIGPLMKTTADIMLTFSSLYHQLWTYNNIAPKRFVNIGYIYDTSFKYVRGRSRSHRCQLKESGADFIICYFDENPQDRKYDLINKQDYCSELLALLNLVLDDPSTGLVIKTQFQWNLPQHLDKIAGVYSAAKATGRYLELNYGIHRNIIFPAEAALAADIAIGHAVGSTASLEAALAGARSIILNPYGIKGENDIMYAQADIVFPSMKSALEAIRCFRSDSPDHKKLGDWSAIIDQFDTFRDGNAGHRMQNLLEQIVLHNYK